MSNHVGNVSPNPDALRLRTVGEWSFSSRVTYDRPFADVAVDVTFTSPSGRGFHVPAFYDGDGTWRVRFNPGEAGHWSYQVSSRPADAAFEGLGEFEVTDRETRGFLRATPGQGWGFAYENGDPVFLLGDTVYNLFGMAHCGADVVPFLRRRAEQGFNILRVRVPVSPFHPPRGYSDWQTARTWAWGGSEQAPRFDEFNLEYFRTVDSVVRTCDDLGLGLEMIMEAWGFEFPFNSRQIFTPEWEELWFRFLIARYDAFASTSFWTPLNEYEYYPNGDWHHTLDADRWQLRVSRWIREHAAHGHIVAAHNGPRVPPFAERFAADPAAVDAIMFQEWGTRDEADGWLAAGIEESIDFSLQGWQGSAILAEWGYERNPELELKMPSHLHCDEDHTRRGAWRGAFRAIGVIHGFENTWGPWQVLDQDQAGLDALLHLRRFFTEIVPFHELRPEPDVLGACDAVIGRRPQALASANRHDVAVYLPVGGDVALHLPSGQERKNQWFNPRSGDLRPASVQANGEQHAFSAPPDEGSAHPDDWVLMSAMASPT